MVFLSILSTFLLSKFILITFSVPKSFIFIITIIIIIFIIIIFKIKSFFFFSIKISIIVIIILTLIIKIIIIIVFINLFKMIEITFLDYSSFKRPFLKMLKSLLTGESSQICPITPKQIGQTLFYSEFDVSISNMLTEKVVQFLK